jgi:hypothetical protein
MKKLTGDECLMLPKDRLSILRGCRFFYQTNPYVYSIINGYVELMSRFSLKFKNKEQGKIFDDMCGKMEFKNLISETFLNIIRLGEIVCYIAPDYKKETIDWVLLEPEYISIRKTIFSLQPKISMVIDNEMKDAIKLSKTDKIKGVLSNNILNDIKNGKNEIELSPDNIMHIARRVQPSDIRGTSFIMLIMKDLMYQDALNACVLKSKFPKNEVKKIKGKYKEIKSSIIEFGKIIGNSTVYLRNIVEDKMKEKIFLPISRMNMILDEKGDFVIPEIKWELSPEKVKKVLLGK